MSSLTAELLGGFCFVWWVFGFVLFFVLVFPNMMQTLSTCFLNQCVEDH